MRAWATVRREVCPAYSGSRIGTPSDFGPEGKKTQRHKELLPLRGLMFLFGGSEGIPKALEFQIGSGFCNPEPTPWIIHKSWIMRPDFRLFLKNGVLKPKTQNTCRTRAKENFRETCESCRTTNPFRFSLCLCASVPLCLFGSSLQLTEMRSPQFNRTSNSQKRKPHERHP